MNQGAEPILECAGLSHRYGRVQALEGVSFAVPKGEVFALLGRNGSGKTSLVRCLLGQQQPTAGAVRLFGLDAWGQRALAMRRIGVVAEEPDAPPALTARQIAAFCARLAEDWDQAGMAARLARFGVPWEVPAGQLSRGQKAQLALALALAGRPELLVLDDPTLGLDPVARKEIYDELLVELADRGTTVFITSHDLAGIEGIATQVGLLHQGRLVLIGAMEELKGNHRRLSAPAPLQPVHLEAMEPLRVTQHAFGWEAVVTRFDEAAFQAVKRDVPGLEKEDLSLEELFLAVVGPESEVR